MACLQSFAAAIRSGGLDGLRAGLIGRDAVMDGGFGPQRMLYADYVASGRALVQVEDFIRHEVLPFYANSHTEASYCGAFMTRLREEARAQILRLTGGNAACHAIFAGSGATSAINLIVSLLGLPERVRAGEKVAVLIGPYEHHSNILPWRESGAQIVEIAEGASGGPDMTALSSALESVRGADLVVGAFSACSNVTGIVTDPDPVTRLLKSHGALAVWDYAGGGPYLPVDMTPAHDCAKDAVVLSPHKFPGGPGASGVLVVRDSVAQSRRPHRPGGGTVKFVSPWGHDYSDRVEAREEGGTPNVLGDIRAALALMVKDAIGHETIGTRDRELRDRAMAAWADNSRLRILGSDSGCDTLPIFSFQMYDAAGRTVHHQLVTRILSDFYGIQARGGCACAGPYAHRLLGIGQEASDALRDSIRRGDEMDKPGWVRLNLSYLHSDDEVARILSAVPDLANRVEDLAAQYSADTRTARFSLRKSA